MPFYVEIILRSTCFHCAEIECCTVSFECIAIAKLAGFPRHGAYRLLLTKCVRLRWGPVRMGVSSTVALALVVLKWLAHEELIRL